MRRALVYQGRRDLPFFVFFIVLSHQKVTIHVNLCRLSWQQPGEVWARYVAPVGWSGCCCCPPGAHLVALSISHTLQLNLSSIDMLIVYVGIVSWFDAQHDLTI